MAHLWEKSYPPGVSWGEALPPPVPIESLLETAAQQWGEKTAIDFYDRKLSFRELHDLAARAAKGFQALGVGPGVHVGLHLPNTPHYVIAFFAVLMAGGRVVNFSPLAAPREIKYQLADSDAEVMVTLGLPALYPQIAALKGTAKLKAVVVALLEDFLPAAAVRAFAGPPAERVAGPGRELDFAELIANDGAYRRHAHGALTDEVAVLQYTGGTTGEPKGAMLTHANFCAVVNARNRWVSTVADDTVERTLVVLPLFHIFGLSFIMLLAIATGAEMVMHTRFDADRVLNDIARKKITTFAGVPTMYTALVNHPKVTSFELSSVRVWASGGAPLPMEVLTRFKELTGKTPAEGYGLTETAPLGTMQAVGVDPRAGTVGLPAPHTIIEVVDLETGLKVLGVGERGEILLPRPLGDEGLLEEAGGDPGSLPRRPLPHRRYRLHRQGRLCHARRPQEGHDPLGRLQRLPAQHRGSDLGASRRRRGDGDRHTRRLSRPVGQGLHRVEAGGDALQLRGAQSLPRRQARQIRDAGGDGDPREPPQDAGRQALEERARRRGDGKARAG